MAKPLFYGHNSAAAGTGAVAFSDNFNRVNNADPGSNWTEVAGDVVISSNQMVFVDPDFDINMVLFNSPVGVATQYQKVTLTIGAGATYTTLVFRMVASNGPGYGILFQSAENLVDWVRYSNVSTKAGETAIGGSSGLNIENGFTYGVTVDGLGNNTVVRIWSNPSGLPLSASNWNGDTSPDLTLTSNPTTPADVGTRLGIFVEQQNDTDLAIDNWFGGSL